MIDHIILTVSDFERSVAFYAKALKPLGITNFIDYEGQDGHPDLRGFGDGKRAFFWLKKGKPDPQAVHVGFIAKDHTEVDAFYKAAVGAGGKSKESPQARPEYYPGYYATWVLDPDGHDIEVVHKANGREERSPPYPAAHELWRSAAVNWTSRIFRFLLGFWQSVGQATWSERTTIVEPSQQHLKSLRKDEEFVLYRSNQPDSASVLLLAPASQVAISLENVGLYSELQRSEAFLAQGERMCQTGSFGWNISSGEIYWSDGTYKMFEYDRAAKPTLEMAFQRVHPDDRDLVRQAHEHAINEKTDFNLEHRLLMPDGAVKHVHVMGRALQTSSGDLEFVGAGTDVTAAKLAEEKIRQSENELRQILDFAPQHVYVLGPDPNTTRLYVNQAALDYLGLTADEWRICDRRKFFHPDDWERATREAQSTFAAGLPHEVEVRLLGKDGKYRWFLRRWNPLRDEHGRLTRWYVAGTDIEDRKAAEQRLQDENISLREELDKASMFEEIVGSSAALKKVLSCISKVAPTDSSVLITGETGTGKELVARAIHRRSRRSSHTFVSVNCAAIPRDLIASELFGHERGAFTGATQRRLGRFELAEKGTLFLDEIGELPAETQIALLRVLQEHEFERIGGTGTIRADVRVIAATNRDLESAIAAGTFRSDLFYRLNVFPIEVPSLRERREDIPLLVRYFLNRYARKAGRRFTAVDKKSLDLLQGYTWPGNIRELQNVIERSVIVGETETFSVDGSWLSRQRSTVPDIQPGLFSRRPAQEKAIIEAALRECGARVSGPSGAAARLGIPGTTLESKIKALKINKNRFKGISRKTAGSTG